MAWTFRRTCPYGCETDDCIAPPAICEPDTRRCVGDSVEACDASGNGFGVVEVCNTACRGGECVEPVCAPGDRRCAGDEVEICAEDGLGYRFRRACDTGCVDGDCLDPICEPFTQRCSGLTRNLQCPGQWWRTPPVTICADGRADSHQAPAEWGALDDDGTSRPARQLVWR